MGSDSARALIKALTPRDHAGETAWKTMTRLGKQPGSPVRLRQQIRGVWCPTCERYHRAGATCEAPSRPAGTKTVKAPEVPRV